MPRSTCKSGHRHHDPISHSVPLSWHWANQYLTYPINAECKARKRQVSKVIGLTQPGTKLPTYRTWGPCCTDSVTMSSPPPPTHTHLNDKSPRDLLAIFYPVLYSPCAFLQNGMTRPDLLWSYIHRVVLWSVLDGSAEQAAATAHLASTEITANSG